MRLIPGAGRAVRAVNENGFLALVISNQSGIARGLFTEADLIPIHAKFRQELGASGARIDRIYYCPHHPTTGIPPYRADCDCRKPRPGMLRRAEEEMGVDLSRSYVIGDRIVDVLAGRNAGAKGILVLTGYGTSSVAECREQGVVPDYIAPSVAEAVNSFERTQRSTDRECLNPVAGSLRNPGTRTDACRHGGRHGARPHAQRVQRRTDGGQCSRRGPSADEPRGARHDHRRYGELDVQAIHRDKRSRQPHRPLRQLHRDGADPVFPTSFPARDTALVFGASLTLRFETWFGDSAGQFSFNIYRVSVPWGESTVTWDTVQGPGFYEQYTVRGSYSAAPARTRSPSPFRWTPPWCGNGWRPPRARRTPPTA
jgi:D-glycero-D-manno-heptose 1,7-bisphosphate phosphatase